VIVDESAATGLRVWAVGVYDQEAGVELLIRAFDGRFARQGCPWIRRGDGSLGVDVRELVSHLGPLSGGESRVLRIAAALFDGRQKVDHLGDLMAGLDRHHLHLVLAALAHAGGSHEQVDVSRAGGRLRLVRLPSLVAWPDDPVRAA
jgi:hypothetical protein